MQAGTRVIDTNGEAGTVDRITVCGRFAVIEWEDGTFGSYFLHIAREWAVN